MLNSKPIVNSNSVKPLYKAENIILKYSSTDFQLSYPKKSRLSDISLFRPKEDPNDTLPLPQLWEQLGTTGRLKMSLLSLSTQKDPVSKTISLYIYIFLKFSVSSNIHTIFAHLVWVLKILEGVEYWYLRRILNLREQVIYTSYLSDILQNYCFHDPWSIFMKGSFPFF